MHYMNGRKAEIGDKVLGVDSGGNPITGVFVELASAESDTCNGYIIPTSVLFRERQIVTLKELLHVDDFPKPEQ